MTQVIKGLGTLHTPQFAVYGKARKELIKKRNSLRSCLRSFKWDVLSWIGKAEPGGFYLVLFTNAVHKLKNGVDPKKVEDWVVKMEKLWRTFL